MEQSVYVIIPAHNEAKNIAVVLRKTKKYSKNIIVVDDGRKDNTLETAEKEKVIVLRHIVNLGKGSALKTGCDFAIQQGATHLIVMDADTQHKPEDIPRFLEELKDHDAVLSYRKMRTSMPPILKFGNWFLNRRHQINVFFCSCARGIHNIEF